MTNLLIRIQWDHAIEYVEINTDTPPLPGEKINTTEYRSHKSETISLRAFCQSCVVSGSIMELALQYSADENESLIHKEVAWGESRVSIDLDQLTASAEWIDDGTYPELDKVCRATVIPQSVIDELLHESVLRISRPDQSKLRKLLLEIYGKCALTGETTHEALEVAHINPVANKGGHGLDNAILLRADLHRLFDAGLLGISQTGEARFHSTVSGNYKREDPPLTMCAESLARVREALSQRSQDV